jgi:hypothetical protein
VRASSGLQASSRIEKRTEFNLRAPKPMSGRAENELLKDIATVSQAVRVGLGVLPIEPAGLVGEMGYCFVSLDQERIN